MCLAVLAFDAHPAYRIVIAANRDEYHARPALPAQWWPEGWLAGRDLAGGGTWLGITRNGRWALLTNVREAGRKDTRAPTRGALVTAVLDSAEPPLAALAAVAARGADYNGFNLLAGEGNEAGWYSNRAGTPTRLAAGTYGISNAALDTPWPKVRAAKARVARWCAEQREDAEALFAALGARELAADHELPATGVSLQWERRLSARFIVSEEYGTRCSTVILVGRDGAAVFEERTFDAMGALTGTARHAFTVSRAGSACR
jgi:uncharacterized protein with NRDE domain